MRIITSLWKIGLSAVTLVLPQQLTFQPTNCCCSHFLIRMMLFYFASTGICYTYIALLIFESVYFSCACNTLFLTLFLTRVVFCGLPLNFSLLNSKRKGKAIVLIYIRPGWCAHPRYTKTYIYIQKCICVFVLFTLPNILICFCCQSERRQTLLVA